MMNLNLPRREQLGMYLNAAGIAGICLALLIAFFYQLVLFDLPCPLCLLQRAGLIMIALALMMNLRFGEKVVHYALALLGGVGTGIISSRQILLHIVPGSTTYGLPFLGLHLYTWAFLCALASVVYVAFMLAAFNPRHAAKPESGLVGNLAMWLLTAVIAANLALTLLQCGLGQCADTRPLYYWLLGNIL
jgi:disulfide bond formation protein DsbB